MDTSIALKCPVFDLLTYSIKLVVLVVDRILYGLYFKLVGESEWKDFNANILAFVLNHLFKL